MARPGDPKGYYARLGIAVWATQQAIDAAFRARTRELDRRPPPDAAERYRAIAEAHQILSDEERRRAYDGDSAIVGGTDAEDGPPAAPVPALPWYRQKPVLVGFVASAVLVAVVVAVIRAPGTMAPVPARALTPPPIPVVPRLERRVVTGSGVNLRLGPGTEHPPTTRIARGDLVELLQPETEGWAYVRLSDGRRGYVAARFLTAP